MYLLLLLVVVVVVVIHHHGFPVLCMYLGNAQYVWYRYSIYSSHLRLSKKSPRFDACEGVVGRYSALDAAGAGIPLTRCDQSLLMNGLPFDFLLFGYEEFILSSPLSIHTAVVFMKGRYRENLQLPYVA